MTRKASSPPIQPKLAPFCTGRQDVKLALSSTGCQSRDAGWAIEGLFSFSPFIGQGHNFTNMDPSQANANPFDQWLLCGINGSCTDLSPLAMIKGGRGEMGQLEFDWKGTVDESGSGQWTMSDVKYKAFAHEEFPAAPVCVWPPFIWIVSNLSQVTEVLDCGHGGCF